MVKETLCLLSLMHRPASPQSTNDCSMYEILTSKSDWTLDIGIENISRFLEQHRPRFEFESRSFNNSMPKEGSSGVID